MTNFADAEGRSDYFAERPEPDHPDPSEYLDDDRPAPTARRGHCAFFGGDRCARGAYLDQHTYSRDHGWICPTDTDKEAA